LHEPEHQTEGLIAFLHAIEKPEVPEWSPLLLESLDRLIRGKWHCPFLAAKNLFGRNRNPQATKLKGNPAADDGV
jgi:hypothetical protein